MCASCGQANKQNSAQISLCWKKHNVYALEKYKTTNPVTDAERALKRHDIRLQGVLGFTLTTPPLDRPISEIKSEYGITVIEGTADAFCDKRHEELNAIARNYATIYNKTIIAGLKPNTQR